MLARRTGDHDGQWLLFSNIILEKSQMMQLVKSADLFSLFIVLFYSLLYYLAIGSTRVIGSCWRKTAQQAKQTSAHKSCWRRTAQQANQVHRRVRDSCWRRTAQQAKQVSQSTCYRIFRVPRNKQIARRKLRSKRS